MASPTTKFYILKGGRDKNGQRYFGRVRMYFNNIFVNHPNLNIDYDFALDANAIKNTFEKLQFKVDDPIINKTKEEMIESFTDKEIDYFGCAVLFVFSHGEMDYFYGTDYAENKESGKINVWDEYYHHFSEDENTDKTKKDWPKFFFNEWCQESSYTPTEDTNPISCTLNNTAHWLIFNAAQPRFCAFTDPENGSFSTQSLCRHLNQYAQTKDLEDILTLVKEDVFKVYVGRDEYLQPISYSSLVKKLYLLPEDNVYQLNSVYRREFNHIEVIGEGRFGVVFKAQNVQDNVEYAIKRIQLYENSELEQRKIQNEVQNQAKLSKCVHVVQYFRAWYESAEFNYQNKRDNKYEINGLSKTGSIIHLCYIQMELCGKTLELWLKEKKEREKVQSKHIFTQIVRGLAYMHKESLMHRDVKPTNILFALGHNESDLCVRIADFGLTRHVQNWTVTSVAGTLLYMAPEILRNKCDMKSDIYSAGLILIELLYNCVGKDHDNILNEAKDGNFPDVFLNELQFSVPTLRKLLSDKLDVRPTSDELLLILSTDAYWNEETILEHSSTEANPNPPEPEPVATDTSESKSPSNWVQIRDSAVNELKRSGKKIEKEFKRLF